ELRAVRDDDMARELTVMADVRIRHDEVVIADARDAAAFARADVNTDELAEPVVRADLERRVVAAFVTEILRRPAEHGAVLNVVVRADRDAAVTAADPRVRLDGRVRADVDLARHDAVRPNRRGRVDLGRAVDDGGRMDAQRAARSL